MPIYAIAARPDQTGFDIDIADAAGCRRTVTGFATEADAEAWIAQDKRLNDAADPFLADRWGRSRPGR